ncbi:hypothetical protein HPP92_001347 [Vanilla planifolia]|uniref:Mediator of RNA polymerase II transcription subunit 27 n=1 Tax=Vanilla planifolia TaxID=51239 RepID=A0A835RQW8_VANPL|nr:hypothetical protein HPP92_001347 [Vanilla planifolia]
MVSYNIRLEVFGSEIARRYCFLLVELRRRPRDVMQQTAVVGTLAVPPSSTPPDSGVTTAEAPPKQVATAMERLSRAARLIANIRIGADRLLEALFLAADSPQHAEKTVLFLLKEEASMHQHFQDLRALGKQLEDSGVLNGSLKSRGNSWGLHMPLVCPDGAVVAYAWKRQLAGQAGASAVDRTRLALKAFTDQKRRFFPHLEDEAFGKLSDGEIGLAKKSRISYGLMAEHKDELMEERKLSVLIDNLKLVAPDIRIFTYQRLDWLKRASTLSSPSNDHSADLSNENSFRIANNSRSILGNAVVIAADQAAVIELHSPSVFRAVVSLHPAGSMNPDAVAFFSTDEGGNYVHARGLSIFQVFRQVTEHADKALQYFQSIDVETSLSLLLRWICSYQTLFAKVCSKCGRLLMMDKSLALILPPVHRTYLLNSAAKPYPDKSHRNAVDIAADQAAVIELHSPFVFRAIVSLHPAGSMNPDAVAFFSTDEGTHDVHFPRLLLYVFDVLSSTVLKAYGSVICTGWHSKDSLQGSRRLWTPISQANLLRRSRFISAT